MKRSLMRAMLLRRLCDLSRETEPLVRAEVPVPVPARGEVLIRVTVCGVCHTELDEIEGRAAPSALPRILGHQVVGRIAGRGPGVTDFRDGGRVGVAWVFSACGTCEFCLSGQENLCPEFRATGRDADGGYADYLVAPAAFVHPLPDALPDEHAAPLLCAGAIGYRSLRLTGLRDGQRLGLFGFGASAHLLLRFVRAAYPRTGVYVFTRKEEERAFAREGGAVWAGSIGEMPPQLLHAVIDSTPVWQPLVAGLAVLLPGGRLVINAIRKEHGDQKRLLDLDYPKHLWLEKEVKSVANVTRQDVREFLHLAARHHLQPDVTRYPLEEANRALLALKRGPIRGATVLTVAR